MGVVRDNRKMEGPRLGDVGGREEEARRTSRLPPAWPGRGAWLTVTKLPEGEEQGGDKRAVQVCRGWA